MIFVQCGIFKYTLFSVLNLRDVVNSQKCFHLPNPVFKTSPDSEGTLLLVATNSGVTVYTKAGKEVTSSILSASFRKKKPFPELLGRALCLSVLLTERHASVQVQSLAGDSAVL